MSRSIVKSIEWKDDHVRLIDQTLLPNKEVYIENDDMKKFWDSIKKLGIRGAPAIGIAAAYSLYLGCKDLPKDSYSKLINNPDYSRSDLFTTKAKLKIMRKSSLTAVRTMRKGFLALTPSMDKFRSFRQSADSKFELCGSKY